MKVVAAEPLSVSVYPPTKPVPVKPVWSEATTAPPDNAADSASYWPPGVAGMAPRVMSSRLTLPESELSNL